MKREELEKYIGELSPEMQEKARQCQTMEELNALLAENDVELSDDALQAVAGGCGSADTHTTHEFSFEEGTFSTAYQWGRSHCTGCQEIAYFCIKCSTGKYERITEQQFNDLYNPFTGGYGDPEVLKI